MIKNILLIAISLMLIAGNTITFASDNYEELFKKDEVVDVKIEIANADYEDMLANSIDEKYHTCSITLNGTTVSNVGIRTKGNSTLTSITKSDSERYSFRVKFDKYVDGQTYLGLDEFVLNNMYADPSYMREYLAYEAMAEAGLNVPLTSFANIYINGELKGFYLMVEALDDSFVERNFNSENGNLYKQEQGSSLIYKENDSYLKSELKIGTDIEKNNLKNMIKVLNDKENIESVLNVDSALSMIAANFVLGNFDSYNGQFAHNYYLYDDNGVFTVIPWDYNMAFGGFSSGLTATVDNPVSGVSIEDRPLVNNLLSNLSYKEKYLEYIEIYKSYLEKLPDRVVQLAEIIRPYIENDPTKFISMEQFENNIIYVEEQDRDEGKFSKGEPPNNNFDGNAPPPNMNENFKPNMERPDNGGGGMMQRAGSIITYATKRLNRLSGIENTTTDEIKVYLNNSKISFDIPPIIENNRTLVPLRAIFEALGMDVNFSNNEIIAIKEDQTINLKIGETKAYVNGEEFNLDVPTKIINDRTLVPLRFIAESIGLEIDVKQDEKGNVLEIYLSE